ncbi:SMC-Scp complex subunit ScpB [Fructilactobacillus myrtifloralis]|uniref:SMC-Scp complex subunit ScpB n=1 Tax=Fructilactobacillus myrtifloralis TaxID=2940301 RepID=A0ABY5BNV7_9LACO|nr:SMC-Scp complex subunit ScpB [Fructilactobacillus myrtifloralis]USS85380.1 SMC-Scp complex subunit ScpB [Fructilactobacillus myrtifloralis]
MSIRGKLEALIYAAGGAGIKISKLAELTGLSMAVVRENVVQLAQTTATDDHGVMLYQTGELVWFGTKPDYADVVQQLTDQTESLLTPAMLETLTIVAYQQPITRVQVDEIRGVNSVVSLRNLQSLGLIIVSGQADEPGQPNLYQTTDLFLQAFGLQTLQQLPPLPESEPTPEAEMYREDTDKGDQE